MNPRLRAAGRLLAFVVVVFVAFAAKGPWLHATFPHIDGVAAYVLDHMIELAAILIFGSIMAAIEHRPFAAYGLPWRHALRARFWQGAGAGLAALTLLVLVLGRAGAMQLSVPSTPALRAA